MTSIVLALAGLTCGDGGPGAGAATAPVAEPIEFGVGFRGYRRLPDGALCVVRVYESHVYMDSAPGGVRFYGSKLTLDGPGRFRLGVELRGTVRREGRKIVLTPDRPRR
jgi:hypothetical protein